MVCVVGLCSCSLLVCCCNLLYGCLWGLVSCGLDFDCCLVLYFGLKVVFTCGYGLRVSCWCFGAYVWCEVGGLG